MVLPAEPALEQSAAALEGIGGRRPDAVDAAVAADPVAVLGRLAVLELTPKLTVRPWPLLVPSMIATAVLLVAAAPEAVLGLDAALVEVTKVLATAVPADGRWLALAALLELAVVAVAADGRSAELTASPDVEAEAAAELDPALAVVTEPLDSAAAAAVLAFSVTEPAVPTVVATAVAVLLRSATLLVVAWVLERPAASAGRLTAVAAVPELAALLAALEGRWAALTTVPLVTVAPDAPAAWTIAADSSWTAHCPSVVVWLLAVPVVVA